MRPAGLRARLAQAGLATLLATLALAAGCDSGGQYHRKNGQWHFEARPIDVADAASFKALGRYFARDRQRGYYRYEPIPGSDGASFEALDEHTARDQHRVYWADTYRKGQEYWTIQHLRISPIVGADPASYQALQHGYGRDVRAAFHQGLACKVKDAASFEVLNASFTRDAVHAYFDCQDIAGSHGTSFALIDPDQGHYARDQQQVYYTLPEPRLPGPDGHNPRPVQVLRGANPATVQALGRGYARDGQRVWWRGQPLTGVDAASFAVLDDHTLAHDAQDAQARYDKGQRLAAETSATATATK